MAAVTVLNRKNSGIELEERAASTALKIEKSGVNGVELEK